MIGDEQAKATKEIAKTTGKFAEIAEKVGGFVSRVIGPASIQLTVIPIPYSLCKAMPSVINPNSTPTCATSMCRKTFLNMCGCWHDSAYGQVLPRDSGKVAVGMMTL